MFYIIINYNFTSQSNEKQKMKNQREMPEWLKEEIEDIKRQEYFEMKREREEQEEREELNDWVNRGGY